ncbi:MULTISPECIES: DUF742 domain-containing protein [unclassified Streptomyces]|uniref:DUF742 domain-containing protein n=1 Tax=unclassified Streptomyces TaxID=2593676 RepID=UPI000DAC6EE4|nr:MULTISPECIES: DUF742 domain-containing protein [unclassified Streptomyces]PZT72193.1 DUF742 domain-containing protein [Streptomyces sp. AC1-42T]PZT81486.1 DUF742 domain-containing protein [Streptomyces sp. AC1-42W]
MSDGHTRRGLTRSFAMAGDAAYLGVPLDPATLLRVPDGAADSGAAARLGPGPLRVLRLCRTGVMSVVEVSARLRLPGAVTRSLIAELLDRDLLRAEAAPDPSSSPVPDTALLERVLRGLERL